MAERFINLVVPLAHKATAMRNEDTVCRCADESSAVSRLSDRSGDVDSAIHPATPSFVRLLGRLGPLDKLTQPCNTKGIYLGPLGSSKPDRALFEALIEWCRRTPARSFDGFHARIVPHLL